MYTAEWRGQEFGQFLILTHILDILNLYNSCTNFNSEYHIRVWRMLGVRKGGNIFMAYPASLVCSLWLESHIMGCLYRSVAHWIYVDKILVFLISTNFIVSLEYFICNVLVICFIQCWIDLSFSSLSVTLSVKQENLSRCFNI